MEVLFIILAVGFVCLACFLSGVNVGQKVVKGEAVKLPTVNPVEAIKEHREQKEYDYKQSQLETILRNIDNYDGTDYGQEEVPRG
jgi:hypothetical protein